MKKKIIAFLIIIVSMFSLGVSCDFGGNGIPYSPWQPDSAWRPLLDSEITDTSTVTSPVLFTAEGNVVPVPYYEKISVIDSRADKINSRFFKVAKTKKELTGLKSDLDALHKHTCSDWLHSVDWCSFPFKNIHERYTADYFSENILVLYYAMEGYAANKNWIESIEVQGNFLVVNVARFNPVGAVACVVGEFSYEINVKKTDIDAAHDTAAVVDKTALVITNVIAPPDCITVYVLNKYLDKVKNESFTTDDFFHENIAGIQYIYYDFKNINLQYGYILVYLTEIGSRNANEMVEYFKTLSFVEEVYWGY